jgi:ribosomal protein S18 acetylase RimI-like enzyme
VTIQLRSLGEGDAPAFWALRLRGFREDPEVFGSSWEESSSRPVTEVAHDLRASDETGFVLGAFAPPLVAIAGLRREPRRKRRHRATLWGLYVAREARGQGVARALLTALIQRARTLPGLEQILLTVMSHNQAAIGLYRALGFQRYGQAPRAMRLGDRTFDEDLMRLDLT